MSEKKIIGDVSAYSTAIFLSQFIGIIASFIMRRFLGPLQTGIWSFVQVILTYSEYSNLGTSSAITREIPFYTGKGDMEKVRSIQNTVFSFSLAISLMVSAGVLIYAARARYGMKAELFYVLLFTAGLILLQRVNTLLISLLRAYKRFRLAGKQMLYSALVNAVLVAVFSFRFKLYGFLIAMGLSFVFNILYILKNERFAFRVSFKTKELVPLIAYGMPLMALTLFGTLFETIDRLMISKYLGFADLGLYSIALMAATYIYTVPNSIGIVMIPNIHEKYGRTEEKKDLRGYLVQSDEVFSAVIPALIGLAWFFLPLLIRIVLPQFVGGIRAMKILVLSAYFLAVGQAYSQFIYVIRRHMLLLPMFGISCAIAVWLNLVFIRAGYGIEGVAGATGLAMFAHFSLVYVFASRQIFSGKEACRRYAVLVGKFTLMLALLLVLNRAAADLATYTGTGLTTVAFLAMYTPGLLKLNQRYGLFLILKDKFIRRSSVKTGA